ncbi:MAG TPA: ABC transporter ATP-binding protein [Conexibacter sp.]|nr:ABC transporter ATP-binding protein [Conexibacter sp.]
MTVALEVRDLHVRYPAPDGTVVHAVQGIDLHISRGERFALVGESGCGKTTSALALMGLLPRRAEVEGELLLNGSPLPRGGDDVWRAHRWCEIAIVFQGAMSSLNPVKRIAAQVAEPLVAHGLMERREARERAVELLEVVGIPARRMGAFPHELSGGMRQRTAIAMALACKPTALIADEPTTALDTMVQAQIFELLVRLGEELNLALLLVTHDLPVVMRYCDRAAVMRAGRIVETAPVTDLYARPGHPYTRQLLEASPDRSRRRDREDAA